MSSWRDPTDLLRYLAALTGEDDTTTVDREQGAHSRWEQAARISEQEKLRFLTWIQRFDQWAVGLSPFLRELGDHPRPYDDAVFGRATKYFIAWRATFRRVWIADGAFPLGHFDEANSDLHSSFHLAAEYFYRQSYVVLRTFLEEVISGRYLSLRPDEFEAWRVGKRLNDIRGKNGMLPTLLASKVLDSDTHDKLDALYHDLHGAVHAHYGHMNSEGLFYGGSSEGYNTDSFHRWCSYVSETVDLGLRLLQSSSAQWCDERSFTGPRCSVCYSDSIAEMDGGQFEDGPSTYWMCTACWREFAHL